MTARRVLVTGGAGFVGRQLIRRLRTEPDLEVLAVSRQSSIVGLQAIEMVDLGNEQQLRAWAARRIDASGLHGIFHLAAEVPARFDTAEAEATYAANVRMTEAVLSLAESYLCPVIYASSSSVYGPSFEPPVREDAPPNPDNWYSEGKLLGETLMARASERCGFATASLRIVAPYGPEQRLRNVITIFLDAALAGRDIIVHGSGERTQDFTFVSDVAEAFWLAFDRKQFGVFNVSGGKPVTMKHLAKLALACMPDSSSKILVDTLPDSQESYRGVFSIDKARRELGFSPVVSLEEGLARCLAARKSTA